VYPAICFSARFLLEDRLVSEADSVPIGLPFLVSCAQLFWMMFVRAESSNSAHDRLCSTGLRKSRSLFLEVPKTNSAYQYVWSKQLRVLVLNE